MTVCTTFPYLNRYGIMLGRPFISAQIPFALSIATGVATACGGSSEIDTIAAYNGDSGSKDAAASSAFAADAGSITIAYQ